MSYPYQPPPTHGPTTYTGWPQRSPPAAPWDQRTESRLGGVETGLHYALQAIEQSFRKADHAHGRVTRLEAELAQLRAHLATLPGPTPTAAPPTTPAPIPPPSAPAGMLTGLTELVKAIGEVVKALPKAEWFLAAAVLWVALTATAAPEVLIDLLSRALGSPAK